jgi:hypothetical protein
MMHQQQQRFLPILQLANDLFSVWALIPGIGNKQFSYKLSGRVLDKNSSFWGFEFEIKTLLESF